MIHYSPPPPTTEQIQIFAAATSLCLAEAGQLPATSFEVQAAADRALQSIGLPRIPPSQALPIWQAAIETIKDPAICPLLLKP